MNPENFNNNDQFQNGKIDFGRNGNFNGYRDIYDQNQQQTTLRPDFTKQQLKTAVLPAQIAREIRFEKYRIFFVSAIAFCMMVVGIFFIAAYWGAKVVDTPNGQTKWLMPVDHVLNPACSIILLVIGLFAFTLALINYSHLISSVNSYKADILMKKDNVPYFLTKDYKSLTTRVVYTNWLALFSYVVGGILIGVFFAISAAAHESMSTELTIMYVLMGVVLFLQLYILITAKYRKGKLNSYYGHEIVAPEETRALTKQANKRCLVVFLVALAIVLFFIAIPYLIIRGHKKKAI